MERPASNSGELSTIFPLSPVSTQPVSPSNRTGHEPSGIQSFSRKTSSTPLGYRATICPSLGGLYSVGAQRSLPTAHWHRSTQCEPHSSTPPPTKPPPFSKLKPSSCLALNGRQAAAPRYRSQSTDSLLGSVSGINQPLIMACMPAGCAKTFFNLPSLPVRASSQANAKC